MSRLSFGKDEVRQHLLSLGYTNLTDEQLTEFCKDLKRLIRYEEKQNRIQAQLQLRKRHKEHQEQRRPRSADSTYSSGTEGQTSPRFLPQTVSHERSEVHYNKKTGDLTKESLVTTATLDYDENDPSSCASNASLVQERRKVTYKVVQQRPTQDEDEVVRVRLNVQDDSKDGGAKRFTKIKPKTSSKKLEERPDFDGGCFDLLHRPTGSTLTAQVLPPRPDMPTKPTTSCIKPRYDDEAAIRKPANRDPVRLYAEYKAHWDKLRQPGDGSDKQLRWAVREWMMGPPPPK